MTKKTAPPSKTAEQFVVRLPPGMRDKIAQLAEAGGRSMNTEIVRRLEWALMLLDEPVIEAKMPVVSGDIPYSMAQDIGRLAAEAGVSFDQMLARIFVAGIHPDAPHVLYLPVLPGASGKDVSATIGAMRDVLPPDATIVSEMITRWSVLADMQKPSQPIDSDAAEVAGKPAPTRRMNIRKPAK